jgi:hypothetical protein
VIAEVTFADLEDEAAFVDRAGREVAISRLKQLSPKLKHVETTFPRVAPGGGFLPGASAACTAEIVLPDRVIQVPVSLTKHRFNWKIDHANPFEW